MTRRTLFQTTPIYYVNDVPAPGARLHHDRRRRPGPRAPPAGPRRLLPHRHRRARPEHRAHRAREGHGAAGSYCDEIAAVFKALWERLDITLRPLHPHHRRDPHARRARALAAHDARPRRPDGQPAVYRGTYAGWYCPRCEAFKDEDELKAAGQPLPRPRAPVRVDGGGELLLPPLRVLGLAEGRDRVRPRCSSSPRAGATRCWRCIRQGLKDFSVSRARVKWGIPVPEEPAHVFYVWMDALANYVTALGFADDAPEYRDVLGGGGRALHFVGKEIIRFHCLYWPAMLHAAGVPAPTRVFAHGWLTKGGKKLSKTTGNIIDPDALIDRYGADAFRYFFLREGSFGQDWDFTDERVREALQQRPRQRPRQPGLARADHGRAVLRRQGPAAAGLARRGRRRARGALPVREGRLGRDGPALCRRSSRATRRSTSRARSACSGAGSAS